MQHLQKAIATDLLKSDKWVCCCVPPLPLPLFSSPSPSPSSPPPSTGLIIDAFGELRDQQEQVKEDMETKCFICGIGSDYFDTTPHGFETHTLEEHNLANYM
ncbi:UNVERIFIED_CONTAM: hypothetical protein FKN15_010016 [Acipenser sinensis]